MSYCNARNLENLRFILEVSQLNKTYLKVKRMYKPVPFHLLSLAKSTLKNIRKRLSERRHIFEE